MWASRKQSGVEGIDQEVTSISMFGVAFLHQTHNTCIGMPRKGIYKIANHFRKRLCWRGEILGCLLEYSP